MPPQSSPIDDDVGDSSRHWPTPHRRPISTSPFESDGFGSSPEVDDHLPRSRSASFSARFRQAGGVNSIDNFARSWQRAACFPEVLPRRPSFVAADADEEWSTITRNSVRSRNQHDYEVGPTQPLLDSDGGAEDRTLTAHVYPEHSSTTSDRCEPVLGTSYGTFSSRISETARRNAAQLHMEQQSRGDTTLNPEGESLLVKQVQHDDGTRECVVVGQSTLPQTIFNSVNVLIGIGLLSLPLAMRQAGWLIGLSFLLFAAVTTSYTAKILAKCLDVDHSLVTYADLAYISFGYHARLITSLLFCLELIGACVALVVLFADSLQALVPGLSILHWKFICGLMLIPLNFLPLRLLSVTSILGILSCTSIVLIICIDGLLNTATPGSLIQPAKTSMLPDNWGTLPLSFGLIMSPWGGHGVFPNIYRDMRHPQKYGKSLVVTYSFTYSLDCAMAIVGWLMFGDTVRDEITANVLVTDKFPRGLSICMIIFIATIPITKVPLNCRPLVATIEVLCGLVSRPERPSIQQGTIGSVLRNALKAAIRIAVVVFIVFMAVLFPSFDRIMALMGSALCFTICIILPLAFHLKIFGKDISPRERLLNWFVLVISSILALIGTTWSFMPQESISAFRRSEH